MRWVESWRLNGPVGENENPTAIVVMLRVKGGIGIVTNAAVLS